MADIVFNCLECGQKFTAPEEAVGTEFDCQGCGRRVIVPTSGPTPTPTRVPPLPRVPPIPKRDCSMNGLLLELKPGKKGMQLNVSGGETDHRLPLRWIDKVVVDLGDTTLGFAAKLLVLIILLVSTAGIGVIIAFFLGLSPSRRPPTLILGLVDEDAVRRSVGTGVLGFTAATRNELVGAATWLRDEANLKVEIPDHAPGAGAATSVASGTSTAAKSKTGSKKKFKRMDVGRALVGLLGAFLFSLIVAWVCFALTGKLSSAVSGMFFALTAGMFLLTCLPRIRPDFFRSTSKIPFHTAAGLLLGGYVGLGTGIYLILFLGSLTGLYDLASPGGHVLRTDAKIRTGAASSGRIILLDENGKIGAWSMPGSEPLAATPMEGGRPTCLAISADGRTAVAGWKDGGIKAWGIESGAQLKALHAGDSIQAVAVQSEPRLMVAYGTRGNAGLNGEVWLWRIGEEPRKLAGRSLHGLLDTLSFSPDGQFVAASFSRVSGTHMVQILLLATSDEAADGGVFPLDQNVVGEFTTIVFDPSGDTFAAGSTKGYILLGDLQASGRYQINTSSTGVSAVKALAFLPDGKRLLCGRLTGELELWPESLEASNTLVPAGRSVIRFVAAAPDGLNAYYSASSSLVKRIRLPEADDR